MTDDKANTVIDVFSTLKQMIERGEILDYAINWDEENNVLDIHLVPIMPLKFINIDFNVTSMGANFPE